MSYQDLPIEDLLRLCADGVAEAWEEFVRRYDHIVIIVVSRVAYRYGDRSPATRKDLKQEVYVKICANSCLALRRFKPQHADGFERWLRVSSKNVAIDYFR